VFQVTKATEVARLDQRRLLLSINHKGTILQVNPGNTALLPNPKQQLHASCYSMVNCDVHSRQHNNSLACVC
jgi:hypothetical protein